MENSAQIAQLAPSDLADLMVDLWRIGKRAGRHGETPETVRVACEIALERALELGFDIRELQGDYDQNMRVRVVHRDGGSVNQVISECLSPAVYFDNQLIRPAEVILKGDITDGESDS